MGRQTVVGQGFPVWQVMYLQGGGKQGDFFLQASGIVRVGAGDQAKLVLLLGLCAQLRQQKSVGTAGRVRQAEPVAAG